MSDTQERTIKLSEDTFSRVENRVAITTFDSVDEYANFVLEEVLWQIESDPSSDENPAVDESDVEARLESLGYLNE